MTAIKKDFKMKKNILTILLILLISSPVFSSGVGYVDYDKIIENYNYAKTTIQELDTKSNELKKYLLQKEEEYKLLESPVQKNKFETEMKQEVMKRESAFNDFAKKREEVVKQKIMSGIEQVRTEKGLDAVLDSSSIYSGGEDITNAVIEYLNK